MVVIAEIGTSHGGDFEKAKLLIDEAVNAGADAVKFQWVYAEEILHPQTGFVNLPTGKIPLYDRFKELEVLSDFYKKCMDYSREKGILFGCSPFGLKSLKELSALKPDFIKIASPELNHLPLLKACAEFYGKIPIIISSGVSTLGDIEKALETIKGEKEFSEKDSVCVCGKKLPALTLLHCSTYYPTPEEEYNVKLVKTLRDIFGIPTGISDHSLDPILVPTLAAAFGAVAIEKHITLSKKTDGLDDPVALEEEQFALMCHCVNQTCATALHIKKEELAQSNFNASPDNSNTEDFFYYNPKVLNYAVKQLSESFSSDKINECIGSGIKKLSKSEKANYGRTNRSLHYMKSFEAGHIIEEKDVAVLRTEKILTPGISPEHLEKIIGSVLVKNVEDGAGVQLEDFFNTTAEN